MTLRSLPNILSVARLLTAPLVVWLIAENMLLVAFWVFVVAAASDAADGILAKWLDARTKLGSYLDPLADKALLVSVYVMLGYKGYVADWLVILVVFRDLAIVGGVILYEMLVGELRVKPLVVSKLNTLAQIVLAALILGVQGLHAEAGWAVDSMVYVVTATVLLSGAAYLPLWSRAANGSEKP